MTTLKQDVTMNDVLTLFTNGARIIDSHDNSVITDDVTSVAVLKSGDVCALMFGARYQSLNPLYPDEGDLRLSQMSVGGVLKGAPCRDNIKEYNSSVSESRRIAAIIYRSGAIFNEPEGGDDEE